MAALEKVRPMRADRALQRQLAYMRGLAEEWADSEEQVTADIADKARRVRAVLETVRPIRASDRVLEVGSGGTGIVFGWEGENAVGVDPLADHLRKLFPWQQKSPVPTIAAGGEELPFKDAEFDIVLSDNVIDHARDPQKILVEIARVLKPGGLFYFTVHVHHPFYHYTSLAYGLWRHLGLPGEIGAFADHTVHLTVGAAEQLFNGLPFKIVRSRVDMDLAREQAARPRHLADRLKRVFFKNATFEAIAVRDPAAAGDALPPLR